MAKPFENLVATLNATESPFGLAGDLDQFKSGMTDLMRRVQALELKTSGTALPPAKEPTK